MKLIHRLGLVLAGFVLGLALAGLPARAMPEFQADSLARDQVSALKDIAREISRLRDTVRDCQRK